MTHSRELAAAVAVVVSAMSFEPLLTAEETRRAEAAHEGPLDELMERAGRRGRRRRAERFPGRVAVVCGGGNNGGDGRVCARVLRARGRDVVLVEGFGELGEPDVIVDALLGIGLKDSPREDVSRMIERINGAGKPVVSVDVPSGVNASTGEVPGAAVRATITVSFGAAKVGLAIAPGRFYAGSVRGRAIGLEPAGHEHALVTAVAARARCRARARRAPSTARARCSSSVARPGSPARRCWPRSRPSAPTPATSRWLRPSRCCPVLEARLLEVGQAAAPGGLLAPPVRALGRGRPRGGRAGRTASCSAPGSAAARARASSCASCSKSCRSRSCSTPTRSGSSSRSSGRPRP